MKLRTLPVFYGALAAVAATIGAYRVSASTGPQDAAPAVPTFTRDVAPILYKNCTSCHRDGEIGPMPLVTYEDARPYATGIRDEVAAGQMPPWHAAPAFNGIFLNERRLTDADKQILTRWATNGAPRGDSKDMPALPEYATGWTIGKPDVVLEMPQAFEVPATGTIEYQYFEVPTNFTEDRWVQAVEVRPGARAVVHHVLVYNREPGPSTRPRAISQRADQGVPTPPAVLAAAQAALAKGATPAEAQAAAIAAAGPARNLGTLLATTAPGTNAMTFRPGTAMLIKAGSVLVFQVHYTANGQTTKDRSSVGMVFAKAAPDDEMRAGQFVNGKLVIPAGAADSRVDSELTAMQDIHVFGLFPHTHLRGKRWEYQLVYPDGRTEAILSVPHYDFNWQTYYLFATPLAVPKGAKIQASAWYDNSAANKSNPDPKVDVHWGDQTWEEMQYTGVQYTVDSAHRTLALPAPLQFRRPQ